MGASKRPASQSSYKRGYEKFWMTFEISAAKLALFRVLFFAVFAIDAWLQIAHAPRYGHLDFNVTHFPFLNDLLPMPTRTSMLLIYTAQTYLALRIMLGGVQRAAYIGLALLFAYGYFISQLNSYQHHYLLAIALGLLAAFPWPSLAKDSDVKTPSLHAGNWPVRMLLVAMSVMYVYAALAKLDGEWTDGSTLALQLQEGWIRDIASKLGWAFCAKLAIVAELALAVLIQWRRGWPFALVLGIGMHMSFHWAGLKIGLFSYFMVTLYLLVIPECWIAWVLKTLGGPGKSLSARIEKLSERLKGHSQRAAAICALGLAGGLAMLQLIPIDSLPHVTAIIAVLALIELGTRWRRAGSAGLQHLVACALLVVLALQTDALRDYYRFWGGNERRAGNTFEAMLAYEKVVQLAPDYAPGHKSLAGLYLRLDRPDDALSEYEAGLAIKPDDYALNRGAAQLLHRKGRGEEALAAAERGLVSNPKDPSLRAIRQHWQGKRKPHAP